MVRSPREAVARRDAFWARLAPYLRHGPLREGAFADGEPHDARTAAVLGLALGIAFTVCFVTGWLSHLIQHPPAWDWWRWPARPAGLYRVTQGLHVATGIAAIPLLLVKLWVVYPHLWSWPPVRGVGHAIERLALVPLVGGSLMLLASGVTNIAGWYPWPFFFIQGHYAAAWVTIGALIVHVGAKLPRTISSLRRSAPVPVVAHAAGGLITRRGLLATAFGGAGLLTLLTVGQTVGPLRRLAVLAPRDPAVGPQGLPVNRTAVRAGVTELARAKDYVLTVTGAVDRELRLGTGDLAALPQREARLPIACVEGWSAEATWQGVPVRELLRMSGARPGSSVTVGSLEPRGPYRRSHLAAPHVDDPDTLLALRIDGEPLHIDHGYPVRLIAPNRPGVMNTKWVGRLVVHAPQEG